MAATAVMTLALGACSLTGGGASPPPAASAGASGAAGTATGITDRVSAALFGPPAKPGEGAKEPEEVYCPPIDVRQGASTITVYGPGDHAATNVRYQATVGQLARECAVLGATMTIKLGMQGRIIIGPKGAPGRVDLPVRFALVQEGPNPKTIWTRLYHVAVDVPEGGDNAEFTHVEDNMTFPTPSESALEAYVIYAGFDRMGLKDKPQRRRRGRSR